MTTSPANLPTLSGSDSNSGSGSGSGRGPDRAGRGTHLSRAFASGWLCARRPAFLLPGFAAVALFAVLMVIGIFLSADRPGGSRITDPPIVLADLAKSDALSMLTSGTVSIVASCVLAVAAAHIASMFSTGSVRILLVRQPLRRRWLGGNLAVVAMLTLLMTIVGVLAIVASSYVAAAIYHVPTDLWLSAESLGQLGSTTVNLAGCMLGFAMMGAALAVAVRSAIITIGVGLCYGLFENLVAGVFGTGARFLPAQNLAALAQGGTAEIPYSWALFGTVVVIAVSVVVACEVLQRRDVLD